MWPTVKAAVLGVPLPLCSCGVIPVGAGLYRQGASRGATSSFLLSTPQTGVDSVMATYALMGPVFAVVRPAVALVNGVVGGLLVDGVAGRGEADEGREDAKPKGGHCGSCCGSSGKEPTPPPRWVRALRYGCVTLPADIVGALLVGLVVAALLTALVPADALAPYLGGGWLAMIAAVLVGAPLYVCATGSIPIALGLLAVGASPGAVLAFLVAGPATNAATISVTWSVLGRRAGAVYLGSVVVVAVGAGLLLDALFSLEALRLPEAALGGHGHGLTWVDHVWAVSLTGVLAVGLIERATPGGVRGLAGRGGRALQSAA
ncbi:MAG: permease [Planctomycetota bacterium]